ncbi:CehA/McbA family metallohydrolase [Nocardioides bigeumensis]|uniref:CehA/McbA family metallohydrolase n=1 Tax=Nocardioides bigeumensis TaxID=433657 RepID=A0ABP5JZY4_9ACTN
MALLLSLGVATAPALAKDGIVLQAALPTAAGDRVVQDDPDNPIKFSIDEAIANGSVSTQDLYIGTVKSYLGEKADGKTPVFGEGFGVHPYDILIMNDRVGIVLAAGTDDPWGYPGGSILDAGRVTVPEGSPDLRNATFGDDTVLTAQFLFNTWDAWAPSNAGMVSFDLVNYNFETKAIDDVNGMPAVQATRKFTVPYNLNGVSTPRDLDVVSYYSIAPDKDYAYWFDTVHNNGDAFSTEALNEVVISNKGSVGIDTKTVGALSAANTFNFVTDENGQPTKQFSTTMISPGENLGSDGRSHPFSGFTGARGYRELMFSPANRPYVAGETRLYESYLMIDDRASWQKVYDFWADYKGLDTFNVSGTVTDASGAPAAYPTVIVNRGGALYGSVVGDADGHYSIDLPEESTTQTYTLRVEKKGTVPSTPSANFTSETVPSGGLDLQTGAQKVPVTFTFKDQNGDPVWGRISVGALPQMIYTGENYYFSDRNADGTAKKGVVTAMVAPGNYSATAWGEGYGFYSYTTNPQTFSRTVTGNTATDPTQTVVINKPLSAPTDWFGVDNHHHGGRMDAFSPPEVSANAQMTAGLEVLSLADHQFVLDNCPVYNLSRKFGAIGYMPNEEITPSWAHHNMMPLTAYAYDRFRDCDQVNPIINTNTNHQGILDDAHEHGIAIGVNHPNSSYGLFLADDDRTVPGGMSGDFDGIEIQGFGVRTINEAFGFWSAFLSGATRRGVEVNRPHYIHGSTDIHDSGQGTGSGGQRSYVHVADGKAKSAADFDAFSLEFSRSQAAGHSFVSNGALITPTSGKVFGNTYRADQTGSFTADFNVKALNNITDIYVFGSTGTGTSTGGFNGLNNLISRTTYTGADLATSKDFTLKVDGVQGKQWFALAAVTATGNRRAITNPIWVNGPDVPATQTITEIEPIISFPEIPVVGDVVEQPRTAILTTSPWSGFLFADWKLAGGNFGSKAKKNLNYVYTLTFEAPSGYVFDPALNDPKAGVLVDNDGVRSRLIYRRHLKALPGSR